MQHPQLPLTCLCPPVDAHSSPPDSQAAQHTLSQPPRGFISACAVAQPPLNGAAGVSPVLGPASKMENLLNITWGATAWVIRAGEMATGTR